MKYIYYSLVAVEVLILVAVVYVALAYPVFFADLWQAFLCLTIGVPSVTACCMAINKMNSSFVTNFDEQQTKEECQNENQANNVEDTDAEKIEGPEERNLPQDEKDAEDFDLRQKWSRGMYMLYASRWDEIFNNIHHPVTDEECQKISLLLWEIASQTVDFVKVDNKDANKLQEQDDNVKMLIGDLDPKDVHLKEYYDDPNTVPKRVIAINKWLSSQGVKACTKAFGYQLKFE